MSTVFLSPTASRYYITRTVTYVAAGVGPWITNCCEVFKRIRPSSDHLWRPLIIRGTDTLWNAVVPRRATRGSHTRWTVAPRGELKASRRNERLTLRLVSCRADTANAADFMCLLSATARWRQGQRLWLHQLTACNLEWRLRAAASLYGPARHRPSLCRLWTGCRNISFVPQLLQLLNVAESLSSRNSVERRQPSTGKNVV